MSGHGNVGGSGKDEKGAAFINIRSGTQEDLVNHCIFFFLEDGVKAIERSRTTVDF